MKSVLIDLIYSGYCAQIQFQALRSFMISQGDIEEKETDSAFYALIWIQVSKSFFPFKLVLTVI